MAITLVRDFSHSQSFAGTAQEIPVPVAGCAQGNTLVIAFMNNDPPVDLTSVADDKGNTYAIDAHYEDSGLGTNVAIVSAYLTTALVSGDTINATWSDDTRVGAQVAEFTEIAQSTPFDKTAGQVVSFNTTHTSGATTTTAQADELLFGAHQLATGTTWTVTGSFTEIDQADYEASWRAIIQYRVVSATGTYASTGTIAANGDSESTIATYKAAAGAGQSLAPSADSVDGNWTDQTGGTSLAAQIDEATASNTDYIRSELGPQSSGCRVKLAAGGDPAVSTGHEINWRIAKDTASGQTINMTVKLYQGGGNSLGGGTLIADFDRTNVTSTFTDFAETLSGGEADAITDYTDLYLEFWADVP